MHHQNLAIAFLGIATRISVFVFFTMTMNSILFILLIFCIPTSLFNNNKLTTRISRIDVTNDCHESEKVDARYLLK